MARELLLWIARRLAARPWLVLLWALLLGSCVLVPQLTKLSIRTEPVYSQAITTEAVFLWGLGGGLFCLAALAQIRTRLDLLPPGRRWRVRGMVLFASLWIPAVPICAIGATLDLEGGGGVRWVWVAVALGQLSALIFAIDSLFAGMLRSIVYLALAWWLSALVPALPIGPGPIMRLVGASLPTAQHAGASGLDSAVWQAAFGSMLALALGAIALDLVRRPTP